MSSHQATDRHSLEAFLGMSWGYVFNFSDYTFGEFVSENTGLEIHSQRWSRCSGQILQFVRRSNYISRVTR
jgi:hypothetical protein